MTRDAIGLCNVAFCQCGERICWRCSEEAHSPLTCELKIQWLKITEEESMQAKWVVENTKPCPVCNTRIEKNSGCNHMTCRARTGTGGCGYEFCWICGHDWKTHVGDGYSCNKFVNFDTANPGDLPEYDLRRLNHYHTRWMNHVQSRKTEVAAREQFRKNMMGQWFSIRDPMFHGAKEAAELCDSIFKAIDTARSILIWSYPHAFFLKPSSNELALFEHVQKEVERYFEELAHAAEYETFRSPLWFRKIVRTVMLSSEVLNKHVDGVS
jgi:ariadne-1